MKWMRAVIWGACAMAVAIAVLPVVVAVGLTGAVAAGPAAGTAAAAGAAGPAGAQGLVALAWGLLQLGKPYVWGAAGPDAFDCSGLALRAWEAAGVGLPRVAADQYRAGVHVPVGEAGPGDLVFFATDPADPSTIVHVGIAVGDGRMVDAPHEGAVVRVEGIWADGLVPLASRP